MEKWIKGIDYPDFMTNESLVTITKQHLRDNETPKMLYERIVNTLSNTLLEMYLSQANYDLDKATKLAKKAKELWFKYLWKGWLSPSTPILANCGTDNGYTISCYVIRVPDTLEGIFDKVREAALLTKYGGGVGITWDKVRGRGEKISKGGFSEGVVPFIKVGDSTVLATSQGATRRGAFSNNLPIRHKDINEFLNIRLPEGDVNRQCLNSNHCVTCDDYFMESVVNGDTNSRELYAKLISSRMKTGQPYVMYYHNVHNQRPNDMKKRNLKIDGTNLCSEILSFHDKDHTVVCDLASVNIAKYDEWKNDKDFIEYSLLFLDANLELYINQASNQLGFENAVRFAKKSRLLGLGVMGWHTYLQDKDLPFISITSKNLMEEIGSYMKTKGDEYNIKYGKIFGSPEWCDFNRNLCLFAIAPTTNTALVLGGVSQEIEPIVCNAWIQKSAKGTFIRRNSRLVRLMETKYLEHNNEEFWNNLAIKYKGSIQNFSFFTDDEKRYF